MVHVGCDTNVCIYFSNIAFSDVALHCGLWWDKCKRALTVLQERSSRDRDELTAWMRRHSDGMDSDMKKRTSEMMATTLRQTDDRVAEVKEESRYLF